MSGQSERKHKAAQTTKPDAAIMRTIIATVVAVLTAYLLSNLNTTPITVHNLEQTVTPHVSAAPTEVEAKADAPVAVKADPKPPEPVVAPEPPKPAPMSTCEAEIRKYTSWNQTVAYNVMMAESSGRIDTHNDDASTGDYSIGCYQINLLGSDNLRAKYRDAVSLGYTGAMDVDQLAVWLKNPANNVAVAHKMFNASGWQPWSATTCRVKVKCY